MSDLDAILSSHARVESAFAGLLRTVPGTTRIPHLTWTAGELGAHVLGAARAYERAAREGVEVWNDLQDGPNENARLLSETPERDSEDIANAIPGAVARLHEAWRNKSVIPWSGGLELPVEVVAGIQLADVLVHGWDLARATKEKWRIERSDAVLAIEAALAIAPHFVSPKAAGFSGVFEIRLRGNGRFVFEFVNGKLAIGSAERARVDCRLRADPRVFLLLSYGRLPVWRAAVTGGVIASGRKPWLAVRFKSLLLSP